MSAESCYEFTRRHTGAFAVGDIEGVIMLDSCALDNGDSSNTVQCWQSPNLMTVQCRRVSNETLLSVFHYCPIPPPACAGTARHRREGVEPAAAQNKRGLRALISRRAGYGEGWLPGGEGTRKNYVRESPRRPGRSPPGRSPTVRRRSETPRRRPGPGSGPRWPRRPRRATRAGTPSVGGPASARDARRSAPG